MPASLTVDVDRMRAPKFGARFLFPLSIPVSRGTPLGILQPVV